MSNQRMQHSSNSPTLMQPYVVDFKLTTPLNTTEHNSTRRKIYLPGISQRNDAVSGPPQRNACQR